MRFLVHFSRVIVGLLFILSGLLKLNDPTGFSYKLEEYFAVFKEDVTKKQDILIITFNYADKLKQISYPLQASDSVLQMIVVPSRAMVDSTDSLNVRYRQIVKALLNGKQIWSDAIDYTNQHQVLIQVSCNINKDTLIQESVSFAPNAVESYIITNNIQPYIKSDNSLPALFEYCKKHALFFSIFMSWLEAILGIALIIGWQSRFIAWMLTLITIFFTFLTWYSWAYNKVTDCGCFGDALPMTPGESLIKNLVIGVFILILLFGHKHIKPVFSNPFGVKVLTILTVLLVGFSLYCRHFLPVVDFLHFKEGNDIKALTKLQEGDRLKSHIIIHYQYKAKDGSGKKLEVVYDSEKGTFTPNFDNTIWAYDTILKEKVLAEADKPKIHDFAFLNGDDNTNIIDSFWMGEKKMLLVLHDLETCNVKAISKIKELAAYWKSLGYPFWALTASAPEVAEAFRHEHQISEFDFHFGDGTQIKSIMRSNPGLILIKNASVVQKQWPSTNLPNTKEIDKLLK